MGNIQQAHKSAIARKNASMCTGNDFSGDADVVALWRFEPGGFMTDTIGSNTLTNSGVDQITVDPLECLASGDFISANSDYAYITDANLDSGFPLKSGESNKVISVCALIKPDQVGIAETIWSKDSSISGGRSIKGYIGGGAVRLLIGYNSGNSTEIKIHASTIVAGNEYHITWTYDGSGGAGGAYRISVYDKTNTTLLGTDKTGNFTNAIYIGTTDFEIGSATSGTLNFDGPIDEVVVAKDIFTTGEIAQIVARTYGS